MVKVRRKILATGKEKGFTLLELLVSLTLMSIIVTVVVLSIPSQERSLAAEVNRSVGLLKACRNNAIISGLPYGVSIENDRSVLLQFIQEEWQVEKSFKVQQQRQITYKEPYTELAEQFPAIKCVPEGLVTEFELCLAKDNSEQCIVSSGNGVFDVSS